MTTVKTRIRIAPDGSLTGHAAGLPTGEHDAEIKVFDADTSGRALDLDTLLARVRAIQAQVAHLPVIDGRSPEEIVGYNERGHFD